MSTPTLIERLAAIPTTIACDILKGEPLRERSPAGLHPVTPGTSFAGRTRVIVFLPGRAELRRAGTPANFSIIDAAEPGDVLVLAAHGAMDGAILGDMLATHARRRGVTGAIVDGAVRDLEGLAAAELSVHARGVAPMAAHQTLIPSAAEGPVRFAGVTVMPGDFVLADRDGILILPLPLVERLVAEVDSARTREAFSLRLISEGFALAEVFPLPPSLVPLMAAFGATGIMPAVEKVREALDRD